MRLLFEAFDVEEFAFVAIMCGRGNLPVVDLGLPVLEEPAVVRRFRCIAHE